MTKEKERKSGPQRGFSLFYLGLAALSGILYRLSDIPVPVTSLMFFSMIPLMYVIYKSKPLPALLYTFVTCLIWSTWLYKNVMIAIPWPVVLGFAAVVMSLYLILGTICSWLAPRIHSFLWILLFPAGSVLIDKINVIYGLGLWGISVSTPMSEINWLFSVASIGGAYLVTFLVRLVSTTIALVIVEDDLKKSFPKIIFTVILLGFAMIYGTYYYMGPTPRDDVRGPRKFLAPAYERMIRVAAVNYEPRDEIVKSWSWANRPEKDYEFNPQHTWEVIDVYEGLIRRAASEGAKIVGTPEVGVFVSADEMGGVESWITNLAQELGITIVFGCFDGLAVENRAIIVTPNGEITKVTKLHLVHGVETWMGRGELEPVAIETPELTLSVAICYDADFPMVFRKMAQKGVDLLVHPSADWWYAGVMHHRQCIYRGVENGMAILRPVRWGISSIVDPNGVVIIKATPDKERITYIIANVPLREKSGTIYTKTGDWVPLLALLIFLGGIASGIAKRKNE